MNTSAHNVVLVGETEIPINNKGFIINFDDWTEGYAKTVAKNDELELIDCHWKLIHFLREFYEEYQVPPSPHVIKTTIGHKIKESGKCTNKDIESVFPKGGCFQACRIAGLPAHYCHSC
ncbi:MAG: TusE/DsrC/DsvC family sulfur relay protein [Gammaproteobacteria bacterium]|nr:TusE/DsrC/DsvC family sulfur relay protein [Gammaproteobacteria bacterium]